MRNNVGVQAVIIIVFLVVWSCSDKHILDTSHINTQGSMDQGCVQQAQAQLSPQWADASKLDRALTVLSVLNVCEETKTP